MGEPRSRRPRAVGDAAEHHDDPRVRAVLEVLAGDALEEVGARWAVEPVLLSRWVRGFVEAGTAQVTNRPVGDIARERDRFLTTFMHGLRSPLAVAQMWVGLLSDAADDGATVTEIASHLQAQLDQVDEQALDVELLTAAMLGRLTLDARRVPVSELTDLLSPRCEVGGDGDQVEVDVDPALFTRVLRDLWGAAWTAGPAPRSVRIEVRTVNPWVELRIVRDGDPIDPAVLHAMFEPFDRDQGNERVTVGLYLARALTVVHRGTIGVDQDDHQTTFSVRIPDTRLSIVTT
ncbi:sensor histidine kinase KdpD [Nocardioides sp.]|uniref:sensor histidine kinase n=1 Tax=Nocardioides sp. TaxID=35761 RepID=UPI0027275001|nr:HAMP domain-containing sensor histidine kinase [Nocardioides sp.]MDO9454626.1 HAMP domain-containing sensor histidine kinase [Nocardioides sp.]